MALERTTLSYPALIGMGIITIYSKPLLVLFRDFLPHKGEKGAKKLPCFSLGSLLLKRAVLRPSSHPKCDFDGTSCRQAYIMRLIADRWEQRP